MCRLVFLREAQRLPPEEEHAQYLTHENDPSDPGYRAFLNRLAEPLVRQLHQGMKGLDYGSGPGPTLSVMLEEQGFNMNIYDPFFSPDRSVLRERYDFITCTETVEHFYDPGEEFALFNRLLRPGGWLGIMTQMLPDGQDFSEWWYVRDPTHVCFYDDETMHWIAEAYGWRRHSPSRNVTLFQKEGTRGPTDTRAG